MKGRMSKDKGQEEREINSARTASYCKIFAMTGFEMWLVFNSMYSALTVWAIYSRTFSDAK